MNSTHKFILPPLEEEVASVDPNAAVLATPMTLTDTEFQAVLDGVVPERQSAAIERANRSVASAASGEQAPRDATVSPPPPSPEESAAPADLIERYWMAAALRYTYRLDAITPVSISGAPNGLRYAKLDVPARDALFQDLSGRSQVVVAANGVARWMLRDEERSKALGRLIERGDLAKAIALARNDAATEPDMRGDSAADPNAPLATQSPAGPTQIEQMLWNWLSGSAPVLEGLSPTDLQLAERVAAWVHALKDVHGPAPETVSQQLVREKILQPFRHLTGEWTPSGFVTSFTGRTGELRSLYDYLGIVQPVSLRERIRKSIRQWVAGAWAAVTGRSGDVPLLIYGPGGTGKSTLLAKLLLDHLTQPNPEDRFPYAYLDFDYSSLSAREPLTLLAEAASQLADQNPTYRQAWMDARREWLQQIVAAGAGEVTAESRALAIQRFGELLLGSRQTLVKQDLPFVLILDTFEEVQRRDRDLVRHVLRFLNSLRSTVPKLRVILMGRAPIGDVRAEYEILERQVLEADLTASGAVTDFSVIEVPLGDLDDEDARLYLMDHGVPDPALAEELVEVVGGNPLSLRLICRVLKEGNVDLRSLRSEIQRPPSWRDWLGRPKIPPRAVLQGVLFNRILGHVPGDDLKKLVHPGLVVRRITPEIIQRVLAGPCGLVNVDAARAEALFRELDREVSLVGAERDGQGQTVLKHRPELRRMMLQLMDADPAKQSQILQVHQAAAAYYASQPGQPAREEELYHLLALGIPPRPEQLMDEVPTEEAIEAGYAPAPRPDQDLRPVWRALVEALPELPQSAMTYLDARLNLELANDADWPIADPRDWELCILCRASRRAREHASVETALLSLRSERDALEKRVGSALPLTSCLWLMEFTLLERLLRFDEVISEVGRIEKIDSRSDDPITLRREAQLYMAAARCAARTELFAESQVLLDRAGECVERLQSAIGSTEEMTARCARILLRFLADCSRFNMGGSVPPDIFTGVMKTKPFWAKVFTHLDASLTEQGAQQTFDEARLRGDLLPGEGPDAPPHAGVK